MIQTHKKGESERGSKIARRQTGRQEGGKTPEKF
jgi:hypothetical protein